MRIENGKYRMITFIISLLFGLSVGLYLCIRLHGHMMMYTASLHRLNYWRLLARTEPQEIDDTQNPVDPIANFFHRRSESPNDYDLVKLQRLEGSLNYWVVEPMMYKIMHAPPSI